MLRRRLDQFPPFGQVDTLKPGKMLSTELNRSQKDIPLKCG